MINFSKGDPVWVEIKNKKIAATITETDTPIYGRVKVQLEVPNPFCPGQILRSVHPDWIPIHKLIAREKEEAQP